MTMHLEKGLTSLNTRKSKPIKLTKSKTLQIQEELKVYNKKLKQQGRHSERLTFDEYVSVIYGRVPNVNRSKKPKIPQPSKPGFYRETPHYPSVPMSMSSSDTARKEPQKYTGERKLIGIATMHKSNLVPVFEDDKQYAKDLARMRR